MAHRFASPLVVVALILGLSASYAAPVDPVPAPQPLEDRPRPRPDAEGKITGTLKSFDEASLVLTLTIDGRDYSYQLSSEVTVLTATGRPYAEASKFRVLSRIKTTVALKLEVRDGKEIVSEVQVNPRRARDPNAANPPARIRPPPLPLVPLPDDPDRKDD